MSIELKGRDENNVWRSVKTTKVDGSGQPGALQVAVVAGGSTDASTGQNALATGDMLYGLDWRRMIKETSPPTNTDIFRYYSDPDANTLISTVTVVYATSAKEDAIDIRREDI